MTRLCYYYENNFVFRETIFIPQYVKRNIVIIGITTFIMLHLFDYNYNTRNILF